MLFFPLVVRASPRLFRPYPALQFERLVQDELPPLDELPALET